MAQLVLGSNPVIGKDYFLPAGLKRQKYKNAQLKNYFNKARFTLTQKFEVDGGTILKQSAFLVSPERSLKKAHD